MPHSKVHRALGNKKGSLSLLNYSRSIKKGKAHTFDGSSSRCLPSDLTGTDIIAYRPRTKGPRAYDMLRPRHHEVSIMKLTPQSLLP
jgi:hypothetical protein